MEELVAHKQENTLTDAEAFFGMCRESRKVEGLKKGLRQVTKSIISKRAQLLLLSSAINNKEIEKLVEALADKYKVPICKVPSHEDIAEYVGISKKDATGKTIKKARCAVAAIEDFGENRESAEHIRAKLGI
ncbi:small subunit ribosomal protein S12e [Nematocida sp. AWRm77]|nr:small subunit ribosomal protein S12e [Nematocida sp. AWRm77]